MARQKNTNPQNGINSDDLRDDFAPSMNKIRRQVAVFCGAREGDSDLIKSSAKDLIDALAENSCDLVYGGGHAGLMGVIADHGLKVGIKVTGVIPKFMMDVEAAHTGLTSLQVVVSMHERKALMAELADMFIAIPGGFGTLDEIFEIITWRQIGLHNKVIGLLNVDSYFDQLVLFLRHAVQTGFISEEHLASLIIDEDPYRLIQKMNLANEFIHKT